MEKKENVQSATFKFELGEETFNRKKLEIRKERKEQYIEFKKTISNNGLSLTNI